MTSYKNQMLAHDEGMSNPEGEIKRVGILPGKEVQTHQDIFRFAPFGSWEILVGFPKHLYFSCSI